MDTMYSITVLLLLFFCSKIVTYQDYHERDFCRMYNSSEIGICTLFCDNKKKFDNIDSKNPCGLSPLNYSLVCCPLIWQGPGSRSKKECFDYYLHKEAIYPNVDIKLARALPREFPHMTAIGFGEKPNISWLCGGSLISFNFVLTAAHCIHTLDHGEVKWVRLGDLDLKNTTEEADPRDIPVEHIYVHPKYKSSSHYHDIALLKINRSSSVISHYFSAACLETEERSYDHLQAIGWGKTDYFGETSSHLLKVNLTTVPYRKCKQRFTSSRRLKVGINDTEQLCAGDSEGGDTCPGDSGGPLHYKKMAFYSAFLGDIDSHFVVVGVTSFGKGCGIKDSIGVYTKVFSYLNWIEDIVWPIDSVEE
ncbi:serine protease snake-like [Tribolium madens]|uniref:serine protease snake-like n=1 Tax=Tribolium madens TaxID=41895 RepID=UPI001CF7279C|nr:serine protease snake-like [Tribolium madens]